MVCNCNRTPYTYHTYSTCHTVYLFTQEGGGGGGGVVDQIEGDRGNKGEIDHKAGLKIPT
jgi:hypothetical protein